MRKRRMSLSPFLLLIFPAIFSLILIFQGTDRDFRIRLTPTGRLKCTTGDGCSLPLAKSLKFLVVGDIGGLPIYPYYSYAQRKVARAMVHAARKLPLDFIINVGDNFYYNGVQNVFDSRIEDSFEEIYDQPELLVPWYTVAGNHDHLGNISAQIAHTNYSNKWTFPDLFYKIRISFDFDKNSSTPQSSPVILEILMLDTIVLCGNTVDMEGQSLFSWLFAKKKEPDGPDPEYVELAKKQWNWIEHQLRNSDSDFLLTVGHYPIYSSAEHGGFECLQRLDSLLYEYEANAYFSGHDHNLQHIRMGDRRKNNAENNDKLIDYIVCGAASRSDRSAKHLKDIPADALLFRYPTGWNPFSQIGFSNGGFIQANIERDKGKFVFFNGKQEQKYTFEMRPRQKRGSK